jgi:hypothetical protein
MRIKATAVDKGPERHSIEILQAGYIGSEMRTQSIHDKGEQLVSRTVRRIKAIDVDKDH